MAKSRSNGASNGDHFRQSLLGVDPIANNRILSIVENAMLMRKGFLEKFGDPRRSIDDECGYPATGQILADQLRNLHDRDPIAKRVNSVMAKEAWQVSPSVFENDDENIPESQFEKGWDGLPRSLRGDSWYQDEEGSLVWEALQRLNVVCGIGHYGVLLIGIDDGKELSEPIEGLTDEDRAVGLKPPDFSADEVDEDTFQKGPSGQYDSFSLNGPSDGIFIEGLDDGINIEGLDEPQQPMEPKFNPKHRLLYLRVFDESLAQVTATENRRENPRYGQPVKYLITFNDPNSQIVGGAGQDVSTKEVHWSRIIHAPSDNIISSEFVGQPRTLSCYNRILDLQKLYGGSAEGYWKGATNLLSMETHPELGGDVDIDADALRDEYENMINGLQRVMISSGMTAKSIAPSVSDPKSQIDAAIDAICIDLEIPKRIFLGSERGELASGQDDDTWNERKAFYRKYFVVPRIIIPFIDRMIKIGVLAPPTGFSVSWEDSQTLNKVQQASVAAQITQALAGYVSGNLEAVIELKDYLVRVIGWTSEEADAVIKARMDALQQQGFDPNNPDPFQEDRWTPDPEQGRMDDLDLEQQKLDGVADGSLPAEIFHQPQPIPFGGAPPGQAGPQPGDEEAGRSNRPFRQGPVTHGGRGSGNFGHAGRPGERGGSSKGQRKPVEGTPYFEVDGVLFELEEFSDKELDGMLKGTGIRVEDLGHLCGAQEDATLRVHFAKEGDSPSGMDSWIEVDVSHPDYDCTRKIFWKAGVIENVDLDVYDTGTGLGTKIFSEQVKTASELGFKHIETAAVRDASYNGYYTWARLGYDAPLMEGQYFGVFDGRQMENFAKEGILDVDEGGIIKSTGKLAMLSDLMKQPGGREWWKKNGVSFKGKFDLDSNSTSMKVLKAYVAEKRTG